MKSGACESHMNWPQTTRRVFLTVLFARTKTVAEVPIKDQKEAIPRTLRTAFSAFDQVCAGRWNWIQRSKDLGRVSMAQTVVIQAAACIACLNGNSNSVSSSAAITGRSIAALRSDLCRNGKVRRAGSILMVRAVNMQEKEQEKEKEKEEVSSDVETTTKKWGLEAGLWQVFTSKEEGGEGKEKKASQAKELLARYGGAYLATSVSLSLLSFTLCYVLVNSGVDVPALLAKVGIQTNATGEKVGTFALAYAAHKAASPIRFPPTVALTPIVAGWLGKKPAADDEKKP